MSYKTGSPGNPYTEGDYLAMVQQGIWHGGWMLASNQGLVYITTNQSVEQNNEEGLLGSQENPFSRTAYNEMMLAETWPGGYVQFGHEPDTIEYCRSYEEQNSACGCGSGCGSGCGGSSGTGCGSGSNSYVYSGHEDIMTAHNDNVKVSLSWSTGYTVPRPSFPTSNLFVHAHLNSPYIVESNTLSATWGEGYNVRITGSLQYRTGSSSTFQELKPSEYVIPDFYRGVPE